MKTNRERAREIERKINTYQEENYMQEFYLKIEQEMRKRTTEINK